MLSSSLLSACLTKIDAPEYLGSVYSLAPTLYLFRPLLLPLYACRSYDLFVISLVTKTIGRIYFSTQPYLNPL